MLTGLVRAAGSGFSPSGLKPGSILTFDAALKRRSSTVARAFAAARLDGRVARPHTFPSPHIASPHIPFPNIWVALFRLGEFQRLG
jgi:hypothetical protein